MRCLGCGSSAADDSLVSKRGWGGDGALVGCEVLLVGLVVRVVRRGIEPERISSRF
jgi:hypothetical protein